MSISGATSKAPRWLFNTTLLRDEAFKQQFLAAGNLESGRATQCYSILNVISVPLVATILHIFPLNPLLFALLLEPLAQKIRMCDDITPITLHGTKHYISLYANDILLYIGNVQQSLPGILSIFKSFGKISGYRINWSKSSLLPLNDPTNMISTPLNIPVV